jgi:probable phosphoglycerate mutase
MPVYLLRHAESRSNAAGGRPLSLEEGDELTALGQTQAETAAEVLAELGITRLIASTLRRSQQTAAPLAQRTGLEVEVWEEIAELRESEGWGELPPEEQKLRRWSAWMAANHHDPDFSLAGGESFNQLSARVEAARARLDELGSDEVPLVVTHGIFLRFLLMRTVLGDAFTASQVERLWQLRTLNCGLSIFDRHPPDDGYPAIDPWICVTWMSRHWDPPG